MKPDTDVTQTGLGIARCGQIGPGWTWVIGRLFIVLATVALAMGMLAPTARGEQADDVVMQDLPPAAPEDGPLFLVTEFRLSYGGEDDPNHPLYGGHPGHPPIDELMNMRIELGMAADGFVSPRPGYPRYTLRLAEVPGLSTQQFHASALATTTARLVDYFRSKGLIGIYVLPDSSQIAERVIDQNEKVWEDLRGADKSLHIVIWTAVATHLRTLAFGERVSEDESINNPGHRRIRERSPVQPYAAGEA